MKAKKIITSILLGVSVVALLFGGCGNKEKETPPTQQEQQKPATPEKDEVVDTPIEKEPNEEDINKTYSMCHNYTKNKIIKPIKKRGMAINYKIEEIDGVVTIQLKIPGLVDALLDPRNLETWESIINSIQKHSVNIQEIVNKNTRGQVIVGICVVNDVNDKNVILAVTNGKVVYNATDDM